MGEPRRGVYPGTFDPLTIAHLAIADAAVTQLGLTRLDLVLSADPIGKPTGALTPLAARTEAIRAHARSRPWLDVTVTDDRLIADIAAGYDVCVLGADKWAQVLDPAHHGSPAEHAASLNRLPLVAVAPRSALGVAPAPAGVELVLLDVPVHVAPVSSSAVRAGRTEWRA